MYSGNLYRRLKKGNYDGHRNGFDYRASKCAGTWNLYKNNKYVKHVGLEWWDDVKKSR